MTEYIQLCERLWSEWISGATISGCTPGMNSRFDLESCPEPYLTFNCGDNPLYVLTTNPGSSIDEQRREAILLGKSPINRKMSYKDVANAFAIFYQGKLKGTTAGRRISNQNKLSCLSGHSGVFRLECCPWHSKTLPNKTQFLNEILKSGFLQEYAIALKAFLDDKPVVALSAISSKQGISPDNWQQSPLLSWQAEIMGLGSNLQFVTILKKQGKVTCAALVSGPKTATKCLILMQGGNHFPREEGILLLAEAFNSQKKT